MTPEERERFRSRVRERWDFNPARGGATSLWRKAAATIIATALSLSY
jgi:hypothetical protein